MAAMVMADMARVLTNTAGTGTYQVGAIPSGYISPFAYVGSGQRSIWKCESLDGLTWEIFEGVITSGSPATISRAKILMNSATTSAAISWPDTSTKRITQVVSAAWLNGQAGASGYQLLPSGLVIQWGTSTTTSAGSVGVTFPIAFPTACASVVANVGTTGVPFATMGVNNNSQTSFNAFAQNNSGAGVAVGFLWIAIGY